MDKLSCRQLTLRAGRRSLVFGSFEKAVPCTLKSSDADAWGGLPASAYMLAANENKAESVVLPPLIRPPRGGGGISSIRASGGNQGGLGFHTDLTLGMSMPHVGGVGIASKYFYHASIESSEMKNLYGGVAALDSNGEAQEPETARR